MSLDPHFLESGKYNNERNPLAFQIAYAAHPNGIELDSSNSIINKDQVILDLAGSVENLTRAVAVLEDQISTLRGSRSLPENTLIHATVGPDDEPAPDSSAKEASWVDSAVIDPSIDS